MSAATEFDVGPLTWVKSEIELALERAGQALQQYAASATGGAGDLTQIKFSRTHLHQVHGALTIVSLDGVTQFAEAVEQMLESIEQQELPAKPEFIALAQRALAAIGHYLDELVSGQPNQPLRLLSLYREVQAARGFQNVPATDLFYPDLSARPPRRDQAAKGRPNVDFSKLVRQERARFQRGFLAWLRSPQDRSGIKEMLDAVKRVESLQEAGSARAFWWVATGLLSALVEGTLPAEKNVKQLCARIDLQMRRLLEGSKNVAERLMRDALYYVASADSDNKTVSQVKEAYHLQAAIPTTETIAPPPEEAVRRKLRDIISTTEEAWNKFCAGTVQSLPLFKENATALSAVAEQLGHTDFRRLAQAIAAAATWLAEDAARHSEALAMEIATAILLTQNAQANFQRLGSDFAHQVDVTVARIHGCIAGAPPQPGSEIPLLDEMSRQAQEKLLIAQVAKEIQTNLAQIEQVLDGFFRDADKRGDLAGLEAPLRQIIGALAMMRHDSAVDSLRQCSEDIRRFTDPAYEPLEEDFERVANQLSVVGFFVESLQHGADDFDTFVKRMQSGGAADDFLEPEETVTEVTVEQEVEQQKRETHALLGAFKEQPDDSGLREEVKQNLVSLKNDAELVADKVLGEETKAMLTALETGADASPQIERVMATLKPEAPEPPKPSAETIQLSQASNEEIDAELLEIFLEEAKEVLGTINDNQRLLRDQPHNVEVLTTIRRSFHTLKGSGRMVGLKDVGEAAWAVEQTLNLWLRQELAVGAPLLALIEQAYGVFSAWVRYLETQTGRAPDPGAMIGLAESLRRADEDLPKDEQLASPSAAVAPESLSVEAMAPVATEEQPPLEPSVEELTISDVPAEAPVIEELSMPELQSFDETDNEDVALTATELGVVAPASDFESAQSAEIISLDFPAREPSAEMDGGQETIEVADLATSVPPVASEPAADHAKPAPFQAELAPANESQQRITISPVLYEIFSEEASAHLATLQRELPILERDEFAPTPHDMYRAAHTLAGISATVGIGAVNQVGLALEHALLRRDKSAQPGSLEALGVIRLAVGEVELMLSAIAAQREPEIRPGLIDALDALYPLGVADLSRPETEEHAAPAESVPHEVGSAEAETKGTESVQAVPAPAESQVRHVRDEIDEQLLPIFLEEAVELNQGITTQLRALRSAPGSPEAIRMLARLLHTLKGSARMAGAMNLGEITHSIETRVEQASRAGAITEELVDELDNAFDAVLQIIERLQRGESLDQIPQPVPVVEKATVPAAQQEKGAEIQAQTGLLEATPTPAVEVPSPVVIERRSDHDRRHEDRIRVGQGEAESESVAQRAVLRVRADLIDRLVNEAGELSIARARIEGEMRSLKESLLDLTENVIRLRRQLRDIEIQAESQMQSRTAQADEHHAGFDPLEFDRFTRFQELTRMMAESVNDVATVQQNLLKNLDEANAAIIAQARLNREVQQELMAVRMVPFNSLADRLYRVVRQTAKELNKRANLEIAGGQVELDRSVLDKIGAPLEHMLRNAVAHGLESRDVRIAAGKPAIGEIDLSLQQEGNEIILSLSDDGAGLDFERIRARAVSLGLLGAQEEADTARLAEFIFAPGFSTAAEVSQIAGRGIGMDVVKSEVTSLGGRIEIASTPGEGTEFRLFIPLTLAVTKALLVRAGSKRYAIPSVMIEQVLDLKEASLARIRDAGTAEWMGHHYPFSYLPHLLGETQALPEQHRQYWTLLVRSGSRRISIQVDELLGNQEIVVKNIGPQLARVIGVDGATVLGDGQVVLILNPIALSTRTPVAAFAAPVPTAVKPVVEESEAESATLPTVMVVDDSLTVRKITGRLLAREGYHVLVAKDGVEALEQLMDVVPDVMLVDIEMPRMDGFDLTRNIRADARLRGIPIIMITSRTADKHRAYAFEIGVNHYLGKPYQEEELLNLVGEYVAQKRGLVTA